ncbi:hypothetical protein PpBr36_02691 [Pyricularia pennisetigena]|uniref:hypothetical protein n=1 Tax=Pyricularia pennisetigena TaxID=1578925 RepID=UPI00114DBB01|nr:hypothetical protein PpBr36_02691 [Pyricularia pennisetigena]TLS30470.1 hypothetical protein PpBr36_02691 [Pyricularia pennisetigena]
MKERKDVISEFNSLVNMTASDLESWLKSDDSNSAGWPKHGGDDKNGETVGHDSGRKIVEILKANPDKNEDEYTDEQVQHMRKVVSYCKRHLAQESKGNSEKSEEELKKTKSYASLKNWGHDILKATEGKPSANGSSDSNDKNGDASDESKKGSASNGKSKSSQTPKRQTRSAAKDAKANEDEEGSGEDEEEPKEEDEPSDDDDESTAKSGQKRKAAGGKQNGAQKKQQTSKGAGAKKQSSGDEADDVDNEDGDEELDEEMADGDENEQNGEEETDGNQDSDKDGETEAGEQEDKEDEEAGGEGDAKNGLSKGDTVSWKWGNNHPQGKVLDVKEEDTSITTKNGNQVSRKGTKDDPAVVLDAGKSKAIKKAHELD